MMYGSFLFFFLSAHERAEIGHEACLGFYLRMRGRTAPYLIACQHTCSFLIVLLSYCQKFWQLESCTLYRCRQNCPWRRLIFGNSPNPEEHLGKWKTTVRGIYMARTAYALQYWWQEKPFFMPRVSSTESKMGIRRAQRCDWGWWGRVEEEVSPAQ